MTRERTSRRTGSEFPAAGSRPQPWEGFRLGRSYHPRAVLVSLVPQCLPPEVAEGPDDDLRPARVLSRTPRRVLERRLDPRRPRGPRAPRRVRPREVLHRSLAGYPPMFPPARGRPARERVHGPRASASGRAAPKRLGRGKKALAPTSPKFDT